MDFKTKYLKRKVYKSSDGIPYILFRYQWLEEIGFISGALVQALPEENGVILRLCNEDIKSYSELFHQTRALGGKLIQAFYLDSQRYQGTALEVYGQFLSLAGLSCGDTVIIKFDNGMIQVKKLDSLDFDSQYFKFIMITKMKDRYTGKPILRLRMGGKWLNEIGFMPRSVIGVSGQCGEMTITLQKDGDYKELVKQARLRKEKLMQVRDEKDYAFIEITGAYLETAGFALDDLLLVTYEDSVLRIRKFDDNIFR